MTAITKKKKRQNIQNKIFHPSSLLLRKSNGISLTRLQYFFAMIMSGGIVILLPFYLSILQSPMNNTITWNLITTSISHLMILGFKISLISAYKDAVNYGPDIITLRHVT